MVSDAGDFLVEVSRSFILVFRSSSPVQNCSAGPPSPAHLPPRPRNVGLGGPTLRERGARCVLRRTARGRLLRFVIGLLPLVQREAAAVLLRLGSVARRRGQFHGLARHADGVLEASRFRIGGPQRVQV